MKSNASAVRGTSDGGEKAGSPGFIAKLFGGGKGAFGRGAETHRLEDQADEALRLLESYEETRLGWFWSTDREGVITYVTPSLEQLFVGEEGTLVGRRLTELFEVERDEDDDEKRPLSFLFAKASKFDEVIVTGIGLDEQRWWKLSGRPHREDDGQGGRHFVGFRGHGVDITAQRRNEADIARLSEYDSLTGLASRRKLKKRINAAMKRSAHRPKGFALLQVDLDRFKQVNDTLGHAAGDELLKQVADRLRKVVGDENDLARLGSDEFMIIVDDVDDRGALGALSGEVIHQLSQPYSLDGRRTAIGASVGIAMYPYDGTNVEDLSRNVDLALYAAKGNGRGRFAFYSPSLHEAAEDRHQLEECLRDALGNGELKMFYQPLVSVHDHEVKCFEALMRWEHPERGFVSPEIFIPVAEEANLIRQLGEWGLRKACSDATTWPGKIRVAVNVSPIQFEHESLPTVVTSALSSSGLDPDRLELEITEGVFLAESGETKDMFATLKRLGVRLALDDFGTGYSSLGYLKSAPFDKIKIDQSFVRGATLEESRNGAIISAIVALANAVGMETTAEGIESEDQLDLMKELGVDLIQGYYFSRPVEQETVLEQFSEGHLTITPNGPAKQRSERRSIFRKVEAVHDNHSYPVVIRNMSTTGALIEGILNVPIGTKLVINFGGGQLATSTVRRSEGAQQGIEFEVPLVDDGNDGFCTRHRVSPQMLSQILQQGEGIPPGFFVNSEGRFEQIGIPAFLTLDR